MSIALNFKIVLFDKLKVMTYSAQNMPKQDIPSPLRESIEVMAVNQQTPSKQNHPLVCFESILWELWEI